MLEVNPLAERYCTTWFRCFQTLFVLCGTNCPCSWESVTSSASTDWNWLPAKNCVEISLLHDHASAPTEIISRSSSSWYCIATQYRAYRQLKVRLFIGMCQLLNLFGIGFRITESTCLPRLPFTVQCTLLPEVFSTLVFSLHEYPDSIWMIW